MKLVPIFAAAIAVAVAAQPATAGTIRPFDQSAFAHAQAAGQPSLIFVHAPWCPTCRAQSKAIDAVINQPRFAHLTIFTVDFDTQQPIWHKFGATRQSTLIGYHGQRPTARVVGETDPARVAAVLASTVK